VKTLLVAPDRLGVLHDVRATLLAARHVGLSLDAVVLSAPATPDASTGRNGAELSRLGIVPVAAEFPRGAPDDEETTLAAFATYRGLGLGLHLDDTARR
jgi:dethiobiotin synthetase